MVDRLIGREIVNKKPGKWKNSEARALLWKLLLDKKSYVHGLSAEDVHTSHEWFEAFPFNKFNKYLADMQASAAKLRKIVEEDNRLVNLEYSLIPKKNMSSRGYPIWRNHPASALLREEIEREGAVDGKRVTLTPLERQKTNSAYKAFPAKVFSQHICQERRRVREKTMKQAQRNKKGRKKHEDNVRKHRSEWERNAGDKNIDRVFASLEKMTISD
jgi:hypothetical protein